MKTKAIKLILTKDQKEPSGKTLEAKLYSVSGDYCTHKHMGMFSSGREVDYGEYTVTHTPSNMAIGHYVPLKTARAIMHELADLDFSWAIKTDLTSNQMETIRCIAGR